MANVYSAERNLAVSPFLKLPGELRNKIYDFVLDPVEVTIYFPPEITISAESKKFRGSNYLALLQLCRQIYRESRLLAWSKAQFVCFHRDDLLDWLSE